MSSIGQCCECYKKLKSVGVPLYIEEESDEFGEHSKEIPFEGAFRLPGIIIIDESIEEYPIIEENELFEVFQQMAQIIKNLEDYETNVLSFWILDMFIEGLQTAQNAKMHHSHQKATLMWIAYFFNYLQMYNVERTEMFNHVKELLFIYSGTYQNEEYTSSLSSEEGYQDFPEEGNLITDVGPSTGKIWKLPMPPVITEEGEVNLADYFLKDGPLRVINDSDESLSDSDLEENVSERNVKHMNVILEILYRIFGRLWVFQEIQAVFHSMPLAKIIDLPFDIQTPKPLLKPDFPLYYKFSKQYTDEIEGEFNLNKFDFILPLQFSEEAKAYTEQLSLRTLTQSDSLVQGKTKLDKKK